MSGQKRGRSEWGRLKNVRALGMTGTLINFTTSTYKPLHQNNMIEFPIINNQEEMMIINRKIGEQNYKNSNFKAFKAFVKANQQGRRKSDVDCMNLLGLDIKKATTHIPNQDQQRQIIKNKINRHRHSMNYSENQVKTYANTYVLKNRNNTEEKEQKGQKLDYQGSESAVFYQAQQKTTVPIKINHKRYLYQRMVSKTVCKKQDELNQVYQRRIKSYTELLWKLGFAHNLFIDLDLGLQVKNRNKFKAYIGDGNNGQMIKGLIKRRFWWSIVEEKTNDINFLWTQIKVNDIFKRQEKMQPQKPSYIQSEDQQQEKQQKKSMKESKILRRKKPKIDQLNKQRFNNKILNELDLQVYEKYLKKSGQNEKPYSFRREKIKKVLKDRQSEGIVHNHLENSFYLGNKKALFYNLKQYCQLINENVYDYIPLTFHIKKGIKDPQYKRFLSYYQKRKTQIQKEEKQEEEDGVSIKKTRNIWIVKPGENSNRGRGITVIDEVYQLNHILKETEKNPQKTYIVQQYIDRPFLYCNRKFDIRHYLLITNINGITRAYWYEEGYIRTSSYQFKINDFEPQIHLTNDAIQKNYPQYGRYEPANKLSYNEFQRYIEANYKQKKYNFKKSILGRMKEMATDAARSVYTKISPKNPMHNFQILGLDFMIDRNFKPWLIQINTNPCLEVNCSLLDRIIPYMVQQSLKLTLDVIFPPPSHYPNTCKHLAPLVELDTFKYELVFDSQLEGDMLRNIYKKVKGNLIDQIGQISEDEEFKDNGHEIKLDDFS